MTRPIEPELAALRPRSLAEFARANLRHHDPVKRRAAERALSATSVGQHAAARRTLSIAGLVPEAPSLLPLQPMLFEDLR